MRLFADEDVDGRRTKKAIGFDVPALTCQHVRASGSKAYEVRDRRAGYEPDRCGRRQAKQIQ